MGLKINLVTYFEDVGANYEWLTRLPVNKISLDFTRGDNLGLIEKHGFPADKTLGAGVVDGRSVFKDTAEAADILKRIASSVSDVHVQSSCSLQHTP